MISSIANLVYELPNNLRLRILGNKEILGKSQIWVEIVSPPEIKLWQQQSKNTQKQISNFSCPVQLYWISLFCSKYFAQDCSSVDWLMKKKARQLLYRFDIAFQQVTPRRMLNPSMKYLFFLSVDIKLEQVTPESLFRGSC